MWTPITKGRFDHIKSEFPLERSQVWPAIWKHENVEFVKEDINPDDTTQSIYFIKMPENR